MEEKLLFDVTTPIGFSVRCTIKHWNFIENEKHPIMKGQANKVIQTLNDPDEIRRSRKDSEIFLFYRRSKFRWICAVARKLDGSGFLITAYPTDTVKAGEEIWKKSG